MKRSQRGFGVATLALAGALVISACSGSADANPEGSSDSKPPITVGILLPLTGSLAALGNEMYNGYKVAQELVNASGGVDGRQIEFKVSDAPTPEDAVAVAGKLSMDDSVSVIMGSYSSGIAIPASEVANRNKKVYWETGSAAAETTTRGLEYLYRTNGNVAMDSYTGLNADFFDDVVGPALGKDFKEVRIGLVYEDSAFGTSTADAFDTMAKDNGWNVVEKQPYTATANDLSSVVQNLKNADVEFLYAASYVNDAILLMKQSKELGFKPDLIYGSGAGYTTPDIAQALGDDVNGIVVMDAAPLNISDDILSPNLSPTYSEFMDKYQEMIGRAPYVHATIGYVGAMALFQNVLPNADPSDSESIRAAADKVDIPDGGTVAKFGIKFDDTGQNERAKFYIMQYVDQQMTTIYPKDAAATDFALPKK